MFRVQIILTQQEVTCIKVFFQKIKNGAGANPETVMGKPTNTTNINIFKLLLATFFT